MLLTRFISIISILTFALTVTFSLYRNFDITNSFINGLIGALIGTLIGYLSGIVIIDSDKKK